MEQFDLTRRALLAALGAAAATACAPRPAPGSPPALTLDEVIRRNTLARGGAAALDAVRALLIDVEIVEGGQTLNGRYAANTAGLVRIDIYAGGKLVHGEGVDAAGVWIMGKDGPQPSVATGSNDALTNGAEMHLYGWHRYAERRHTLALMPAATIDGIAYQVVEARLRTGHTTYHYVDPVSWHAVRRRDTRAYHPDVSMDKKRIETRSLDWTAVDGVVAAHRNEDYDLDSGKLLATNRVLARTINPPLAAAHFDRNRPAPATW